MTGTIARLWRYPVKSMLGEDCAHIVLDERGVRGDRVFAVRDADGKLGSGKTTRGQAELPDDARILRKTGTISRRDPVNVID